MYIMNNLDLSNKIESTVKNIWRSYIWTADKDMNESDLRSDVHYLGSSENKAWKKFRPVRDLNPWPLRYRCSALPTELNKPVKWWIDG